MVKLHPHIYIYEDASGKKKILEILFRETIEKVFEDLSYREREGRFSWNNDLGWVYLPDDKTKDRQVFCYPVKVVPFLSFKKRKIKFKYVKRIKTHTQETTIIWTLRNNMDFFFWISKSVLHS